MIVIERTENEVIVTGHSTSQGEKKTFESTQACASITALTHALLYGIVDELKEHPDYTIEKGNFRLNLNNLSSQAMMLVNIFMRAVEGVSTGYPQYITVR